MKIPISRLHGVRWFDKRIRKTIWTQNQSNKHVGLFLAVSLFLVSMLFSACSGLFGSASPPLTPTVSMRALNKINWCTKPLMVFRDEGDVTPTLTPHATATTQATGTATPSSTSGSTSTPTVGPGTPQTISDWSVVKASLGFTVYLPATLPDGACLVSAQATIHDPIFGGSFYIGYLLADHTSLSLSEAPLKSQSTTFQCNGTNTPTPTVTGTPNTTAIPSQLCSGAKNTTNIVISGPGTVGQLQQIFNSLQTDVDWIPAS